MSEIVLDAILRLFAVVARQDELNRQEREQIRQFLLDHVNEARVESYLARFVAYSDERKSADLQEEKKSVQRICQSLVAEITQRQKLIILV